jgi:hypothetical protein
MKYQNHRRQLGGMTLVEVMIAVVLMVSTLGTLMVIGLLISREQKLQLAAETVSQKTNLLQDRLLRLLREMSETEGIIFGNQIPGQNRYRMIIMGRGPAPDYPRERLAFDPMAGKLIYASNSALTGSEQVLFQSIKGAKLLEMAFYPSLQVGDVPNNSLLNIKMQVGDDGLSGRRLANGNLLTNFSTRYFAVRMRNH